MNFIFFGTPAFAVIILKALIEAYFKPALIITAPDKPMGRGHTITPPPIKILAAKHGISVLQPTTLKNNNDILRALSALRPDFFIVAAYGKIIPKEILAIPQKGGLNIHPSLLPCYRGPSPIQAAILHGDETTGITIMLMDEEMDHGPILAKQEWEISNFQNAPLRRISGLRPSKANQLAFDLITELTAEKLSYILAELGAKLLIETIPKWLNDKITPQEQDHAKATYTKIITKEDGYIDWHKSAEEIERMVRAYTPWPSAWTMMCDTKGRTKKEMRVKIRRASLTSPLDISKYHHIEKMGNKTSLHPPANSPAEASMKAGTIIKQNSDLLVACGNDFLTVGVLQVEGGKPMSGAEFLRGYESRETLMFGLK